MNVPYAIEWVAVPLGAWLLLWGAITRTGMLEAAGGLLVGATPLAASLVDAGAGHAVSAGLAGIALFLVGTARGRIFVSVVGTGVVAAEAMLQVHRVLVSMPWQIYATVAGLFLIALGLLVERRRQQIAALGQRLATQWSG
jgi:hypothetical protein